MAVLNSGLKPFVINQTDIQFILDQINFLPLFDLAGNAIINWDGTGRVYNSSHVAYADRGSISANIAAYGTSYQSIVDLTGLRDVTGLNNNLSLINASWGAVDQIFTRSAAADYANYSPIMQAVAAAAYYAAKQYYSTYSVSTGTFAANKTDYTITNVFDGTHHAADGTAITIKNVVDYTPRMISLATTTAGVTYDTWANHAGDPGGLAGHQPTEIYYDAQGVATVLNWGQLETVALGGQGQVDTQARLAASAGQNDHFIGGLNPGVSPSNGLFVLFGQFFDHGLDFIGKSSGATIKIALAADDPLYGMKGPDGQPVHEITINRATVQTVDANGPEYVNHTSPFIDQSQTYGSHEQLTNLLREWVPDLTTAATGDFHAGMKLFDGKTLATPWTKADGTPTTDTLPALNELRAHVVATGRDALTWDDVLDLRNRDAGGHVTTGTSGAALILDMNPRFDQASLMKGDTTQDGLVNAGIAALNTYLTRHGGGTLSLEAGGVLTLTGSAFGGPLTGASALLPFVNFADFSIKSSITGVERDAVSDILMASVGDHYIAGDGRVNENFGLTSIHHVFHEEHNFQVQNLMDALHTQDVVTGDTQHVKLHEFQIDTNGGRMNTDGDYIDGNGNVTWDMDKMFNGAKLVVEMEYQHAAVDQYARNVTPNIQEFVGYSPEKNAAVSLEYAQSAFRFGHSTLRETIDTIDPTHGLTGKIMGYALKEAFLSPEKYAAIGPASVLLGMSHQQMNEVDEFVTPALNQGLLGQPLDLAAINIARGRDLGIPTLNDFRAAIGLARYTSWTDFGQNMQHPSSLVNFIAAYSFDGDLAKATAIMGLVDGTVAEGSSAAQGFTVAQAYAFVDGGDQGFNHIDTWLGGLAEIHQPGGILGETFDKVFVNQIESLMDGDRFYYLYRLAGQQFGEEVGNAQLKDIVERNTGLSHLNGNIFGYADQYIDLGAKNEVVAPGAEALTTGNEHKYGDNAAVAAGTMGIYSNGGRGNLNDGHVRTIGGVDYIQDTRLANTDPNSAYGQNGFVNLDGTPNSGAESNEVIVGTKGSDLIYAQGGDDTVYGDGGNDIIYGGYGIDRLYGGAGSDHIYGGDNPDLIDGGSGDDFLYGESSGTDINGADQIIGGSGNDYIDGGIGIDKLSGGSGDDHILGGQDTDPFTHGSDGNDLVEGNSGGDILYGDNGDDVLLGGADQDQMFGGNGDDIIRPGDTTGALTIGTDEVLGGDGVTDEGNKPGTIGFDLIDFSDNALRPGGVTFNLADQQNPALNVNGIPKQIAAFQMEGLIGSVGDDTLTGDDGANWLIGGSGNDTFEGGAGNDVIVGGHIRLDTLIGKYQSSPGVLSTYDHNNDNPGLTAADQLQDARYQGASHRVGYQDVLAGGLLAGAGFDRHFTEMLRSDQFKNQMLGDGGTDGAADTVVYAGDSSDYTVVALDVLGNVLNDPSGADASAFFAVKITANIAELALQEGTDIVVGVEKFSFNGVVKTIDQLFNHKPTGSIAFTATEAPVGVANSSNAVRLTGSQLLFDMDNITGNNPLGAVSNGAVSYSWTNSLGVAISTTTGNNPYVDGQSRLVLHTTTGEGVNETATYVDANGTTETITKAWNMVVGTSRADAGLNGTASTTVSDAIFGLAGNDTLNGLAGNDYLYGGAGADSMRGGSGDDNYFVDNSGDVVDERTYTGTNPVNNTDSGGIDTVNSSINYTLASSTATGPASRGSIENLTLTGDQDINATGNALDNLLKGNSGNNTLDGVSGNDTAAFNGLAAAANFVLRGAGNVLTVATNNGGTDTLRNIDNVTFGTSTYNLVIGTNNANTIAGTANADLIVGGQGNDTITGGAGDDVIVWTATGNNNTNALFDGRDIVDGGANASPTSMGDTYVVRGNNQAETFNVYTRADWLAIAGNTAAQLSGTTEIVIARNGLNNASIIAELANIEEIRINTGGGTDTVNVSGNFDPTHLSYNTITVDDGGGKVKVDVTAMMSAHHIALLSTGGDDTIVGQRAQDQIIVNADTAGNSGNTGGGTGSIGGNTTGGTGSTGGDTSGGNTDTGSNNDHDEDHDDDYNDNDNSDHTPAPIVTMDHDLTLMGDGSANLLTGAGGNDVATGAAGDDMISLGSGDDFIDAGAGNDTVMAGSGNDTVYGQDGNDTVFGGDGNDMINAGTGDDHAFGGAGDDVFVAGANDGTDRYYGEAGTDTLDMSAVMANIEVNLGTGSAGWAKTGGVSDQLYSIENIVTGSGNDTITASGAHNVIDTGAGQDTVAFRSASDANGDTILNFEAGDKINVSGFMGGSLTLVSGTTAAAHQIAVNFENISGENFTVLRGIDGNDNHFEVDIKGHHNLTGTDFAA